jgi:hypothetical protein
MRLQSRFQIKVCGYDPSGDIRDFDVSDHNVTVIEVALVTFDYDSPQYQGLQCNHCTTTIRKHKQPSLCNAISKDFLVLSLH